MFNQAQQLPHPTNGIYQQWWSNNPGQQFQCTPIQGYPQSMLQFQPYIEACLRVALQEGVQRSPLHVFLFNQMAYNGYANPDFQSLVLSTAEMVEMWLGTGRVVNNDVATACSNAASQCAKMYVARAVQRHPALQSVVQPDQVVSINQLLQAMTQAAAEIDHYQQRTRQVATHQAVGQPTAAQHLLQQTSAAVTQTAMPQHMGGAVTFAPVVGGVTFDAVSGPSMSVQSTHVPALPGVRLSGGTGVAPQQQAQPAVASQWESVQGSPNGTVKFNDVPNNPGGFNAIASAAPSVQPFVAPATVQTKQIQQTQPTQEELDRDAEVMVEEDYRARCCGYIHPPLYCLATHYYDPSVRDIVAKTVSENLTMDFNAHQTTSAKEKPVDQGRVVPIYKAANPDVLAASTVAEESTGTIDLSDPIIMEDVIPSGDPRVVLNSLKFLKNVYDESRPLEYVNLRAMVLQISDRESFNVTCSGLFADTPEMDISKLHGLIWKALSYDEILFNELNRRATETLNRILNVSMGVECQVDSFADDWMEVPAYVKNTFGVKALNALREAALEIVHAVCCLASGDIEEHLINSCFDQMSQVEVSGLRFKAGKVERDTPTVIGTRRKALLRNEDRKALMESALVLIEPEYVVMIPADAEDLCLDVHPTETRVIGPKHAGNLYDYLEEVEARTERCPVGFTRTVLATYEGRRFDISRAKLGDTSLFCAIAI